VTLRCTFCHDGLGSGLTVYCAACLAPHHADCHAEHGSCAGPGCGETRAVQPTPRRRGGRLTALLLFLLTGGLVAALRPADAPPARPVPAPAIRRSHAVPCSPAPTPQLPATRRPVRLETTDLRLTTRGFDYPIRLQDGERLVLRSETSGYVHVHRLPPSARQWQQAQVVMVVEPGDVLRLCGPGVQHTLAPSPAHAIGIERDGLGFLIVDLGDLG